MKLNNLLDITSPIQTIEPGPLNWHGTSPEGHTIDFTNYYMRFDDKPLVLVAGEMHPTRTNPDFWEESILRMKSGGLNTVSFYVLWNHIEKRPGEFDFTGNRNIRKFVQLCAKHNMYAWPRIGPFCNSESSHGGLPSWLYGFPIKERSNDSGYLFFVEQLYKEIGKQFEGLFFKDGGPILSVQIENEYGHAPALWTVFYMFGCDIVNKGTDGESHMRKLKELAVSAGIVVPFYSCTGWGDSPIPYGEFLPTSGCYAYLHNTGPSDCSTFCIGPKKFDYPAAYSELGGGTPGQLRWRPDIPSESVEAGIFTRVACGGNMTGIYMYHGGTNPENYDRFYAANGDLNLMSYDFTAPIGEFGIVRDSYYQIRPIQQFLLDFGRLFAPMVPVWQDKFVESTNIDDLRYMARVQEDSGFLFINNFQDKLELPTRTDVSFKIKTNNGDLLIPENKGITIRSGAMPIIPFNLKLGKIHLKYAISQLLCRVEDNKNLAHYFFFSYDQMEPEFAFEGNVRIDSGNVRVNIKNGTTYVVPNKIGFDSVFYVTDDDEKCAIVILSEHQARRCIKGRYKDKDRLLYSEDCLIYTNETITTTQIGKNDMSVGIFPAFSENFNTLHDKHDTIRLGLLTFYSNFQPENKIDYTLKRFDDDKVTIRVENHSFEGLNDIYMKIDYEGDGARIFHDGLNIADHFYKSEAWYVSLKRYRKYVTEKGLCIRVNPVIGDVSDSVSGGITFQYTLEEATTKAKINSIELIPEYRAVF